ncbi:MAG: hypothetical protein DRI39_10320 [Chloroflexi bacterium]|nr:MAG: hypothetical protein DRI39_10320 [Chloroflexota bacterium]
MTTATIYQVQVSRPFTRNVESEPDHYANRTFVNVSIPEIGFTAMLEYTTDSRLKTALKPLIKAFVDGRATRTIEVSA